MKKYEYSFRMNNTETDYGKFEAQDDEEAWSIAREEAEDQLIELVKKGNYTLEICSVEGSGIMTMYTSLTPPTPLAVSGKTEAPKGKDETQ